MLYKMSSFNKHLSINQQNQPIMKNIGLTLVIALGMLGVMTAQHTQVRDLEPFDKVNLDGNAKLFLIKSDTPSVELDVKKEAHLDEYVTEVRNGTLYLHFKKKRWTKKDHKIKVYLNHTGVNDIDLDGIVRVETDRPLTESSLKINGDGFIKGNLEVDVNDLTVDLDGFSGMTITGSAERASFSIDGFGKINAQDLRTSRVHKDSDGFARIKVRSK